MFRSSLFCGVLALIFSSLFASSQELPNFPGPEKEHELLKNFVGQWATTSECTMGPGQPPMQCAGTVASRMIGHFWVVNEIESSMLKMPVHGIQTLGYDAKRKKYVGTWVDSVMNHFWQYEGTYDKATKRLTLKTEGPNFFFDGSMAKYREIYEFKSPDHIHAISLMLEKDGKWVTIMTGDLKRSKSKSKL